MRKYNLKRDISYYQGKIIAYNEMVVEISELFVQSDFKNAAVGRLLSSVEILKGSSLKLLHELEDLRDKKTK